MSEFAKCGGFTSYPEIEVCFSEVYNESDKFLNKEYSQLMQYLDGLENKTHKKRLVSTQRTWVKFRDSDCNFYSDGQAIRMNICLSERTIQRLKELENFNTNYAMGCNGCPW
ncbi:lysozyme inhibitor LprI family protein [Microbulbifer sp. CnH-101-E]|uniref:lysozyme inhibitor LprI family protein n=1 Tax=unclassified Microbulbifer TaxID=2619833 RepID=UPI00403A7648